MTLTTDHRPPTTDSRPVRTRFAPSPTGHLHVGVCRTAIFAWALARHYGGQFLLRIEDTDKTREVEGAFESIQEDLRWLGLEWDEGPDKGGSVGPYVQSQRLPMYLEHAEQLIREGKAYRCYCTKERLEELKAEQVAAKLPPGYDRRCRNLSPEEKAAHEASGEPSVVRIAMPLEGETVYEDVVRGELRFQNRTLDDYVAIKSDGFPTYNFANVVDDHLMGITHIIRGEEFLSSTPRYTVVYDYFGWTPPAFIHVPLVLGPDRAKLSKRHGDTRLAEYADQGYLPEAMVNFLALLGWSPGEDLEVLSREEMVGRFTEDRFQKHSAIFDLQKLEWMNGMYIRALPPEDLARRILPWLTRAGLLSTEPSEETMAHLIRLVPLVQERMKRLAEASELLDIFLKEPLEYDPVAVQKRLKVAGVPELLEVEINVLKGASNERERFSDPSVYSYSDSIAVRNVDVDFDDPTAIEAAVREAGESVGMTGGKLIHPIRVAVTGRAVGPSLFDTMSALGKEVCIARLYDALLLAKAD